MSVIQENAINLPREIEQEIIAHSREGTPEEICGILRGRGLTALELIRARNIADERIENYTVDPKTLLRQFDFEDAGDSMMGIYHSHPVSEAYPSATDCWNAHYPDSIYLICSLEFTDSPVIRAFRMTPHFLDLDLNALRGELDFYETRPGLFAYFQAADVTVARPLLEIVEQVDPPFYVVFYVDPEEGRAPEGQVVSIVEYAVNVSDATRSLM